MFPQVFRRHALILALALAWPLCATAQATKNGSPAETSSTPPVPSGETVTPPEDARPGAAPGRTVKPQAAPAAGTPFQWGSFLVYPEIDVTYFYDDNVYYLNSSPLSDHAWVLSPALWVQSNWAQHALNFYAAVDSTQYQRYETENTDDYRVSAEGRYDISANTNVYGGARYSQDHEDRESPEARNGLLPTRYWQYRYYGGFFHQIDRLSIRIAGTANKLNYDDVPFLTGGGGIQIINNDDRDRWQYTGGVRLGYEVSPRFEPYLQLAVDNRKYNELADQTDASVPPAPQYEKSSKGQRYLAGIKWNVPRTVKLDAFAGLLKQNFDDPRFSDISKPVFGGALLWAITADTRLSAYLDRTLEETAVTYTPAPNDVRLASSYLNTYASAGVNHRLTQAWSLRADLSKSEVDYQNIDRTDDYYGATFGVGYRLHPNVFLDLSYSYRKLDSSIPGEDFKKRMTLMRVAIPFSH
ncbi:MAG: hypothetical protein AMJ64_10590 [Betaproteobacteria bacterium SG8_39]|nr:MAG: hypothetical protein AMJ64_10590 [Betaproteobacteria bacterium SG8_39]